MFKDPERVLDQFVLGPGRVVADFGSGSGAYAFAASRRVGDTGKVYAIDIQKDLIQKIKNAAKAARLLNIEIYWGDIEKRGGTGLRDESVDSVIISNVLFQVDDKAGVVREAHRILKQGGRALVVDWSEAGRLLGPPRDLLFGTEEARTLFENNHFIFERAINAGAHYYGLVFRKM